MICDKKLRMLFLPFFFQVEYNWNYALQIKATTSYSTCMKLKRYGKNHDGKLFDVYRVRLSQTARGVDRGAISKI